MKKTGKIFSVVLAIVLVFAMAVPAFAADTWTGDITIKSATNVSVNGKTFNAYQILAAEAVDSNNLDSGVIYSIPAAMQSFYNGLCGGDDSVATVDEVVAYIETADLQDFAEKALAAAIAANIVPAAATGADDKATFTGLEFGYYVISDTTDATEEGEQVVSALMLRTTSAEVTIKADKPSLEKKIDGDNDKDGTTTGFVDYNTATVGEKVPYVLTSKVPDMTGYDSYTYTVTDTFSAGLTFNNDVAITVGTETLAADTDYTVTVEGQKVTIDFIDFKQYAKDADITIKYTATVNSDAVIGVEGNPNAADLTYSNNPQDLTSKETTPDEIVYTYLVDLIINKTDKEGNALEGAEFEVKQGETTLATGKSNAEGKVEFSWTNGVGLKDGEIYTITETKAPAGYNEAEDIVFTVTCTDPTTGTDCTWSATTEDDTAEKKVVTFTLTATAEADDYFETTVINETGSLLPETGGIGTTIFYIVGALLVVGAVVLLITKKRMSAEA